MTYADDLVILCRKGNADEALRGPLALDAFERSLAEQRVGELAERSLEHVERRISRSTAISSPIRRSAKRFFTNPERLITIAGMRNKYDRRTTLPHRPSEGR